MRRLPLLLGLALVTLGGGACDWTKFDDLALKAGVRAVTRPDDMDSNLYPSVVLPVTTPRGNAELLVLGADNGALADFTFGADGHMGTQTVASDRFLLNGAKIGPLATQRLADRDYTLAAYLPDPSTAVPRLVAVLDQDRQPIVVTLDSTTVNFAIATLGDPLTVEVGAIAVGSTSVGDRVDAVIAAGPQILVYPQARAEVIETCTLEDAVAAVAVGDQWIAAGQSAATGRVWLLTPPYENALDGQCLNRPELDNFTGSMGFGTALLAADVNEDGPKELVVSAPEERAVYVYQPADLTAVPAKYLIAGGSGSCGTAIAFGKVEGARTLIIGDPDYTGPLESPGIVWLQDLETDGADPQPLVSPNPDDVLRFGQQVGVVSFAGAAGPVDLVWATAEAVTPGDPGVLYLFFWVSSAETDPRAFGE